MVTWKRISEIFSECFKSSCTPAIVNECFCKKFADESKNELCGSISDSCFAIGLRYDNHVPVRNVLGASISVLGCSQEILGARISLGGEPFQNGQAVNNAAFEHITTLEFRFPEAYPIEVKCEVVFKLSDGLICNRTVIKTFTNA